MFTFFRKFGIISSKNAKITLAIKTERSKFRQMSKNLKKIILFILVLSMSLGVFGIISSASFLGTAGEAISNEVNLVKTGLCGQKINFSDTDFKTALGITTFKKITILSLPSSKEGTLFLSDRRVGIGQSVSRRNLEDLCFVPADENVTESSFTFSVIGTSEETITCTLKFLKKINHAPEINTDASKSLNVTTQKGIAVFGNFEASDPEDDNIDYIIVSYPKYGTLSIENKETGEFKYTPGKDFSGKDSFIFTVRDEYGNYASPESVSIKIIDRMSDVTYVDMEDSREYNAAVAMTAMGIMSGTRIGDDMYFLPEETVTRAEFLTMAMKTLGIKADTTLTETFFDDNDKIPAPLVSYVATAAKCGIINGSFDGKALNFRPNDAITHCEAAIIMANLMNKEVESPVFSVIEGIADVPVWARAKVGAMYEIGVFAENPDFDVNATICRKNAAEYLYKIANIK